MISSLQSLDLARDTPCRACALSANAILVSGHTDIMSDTRCVILVSGHTDIMSSKEPSPRMVVAKISQPAASALDVARDMYADIMSAYAHINVRHTRCVILGSGHTDIMSACDTPLTGYPFGRGQPPDKILEASSHDTTTPHGRLMHTVLGWLTEFEP